MPACPPEQEPDETFDFADLGAMHDAQDQPRDAELRFSSFAAGAPMDDEFGDGTSDRRRRRKAGFSDDDDDSPQNPGKRRQLAQRQQDDAEDGNTNEPHQDDLQDACVPFAPRSIGLNNCGCALSASVCVLFRNVFRSAFHDTCAAGQRLSLTTTRSPRPASCW